MNMAWSDMAWTWLGVIWHGHGLNHFPQTGKELLDRSTLISSMWEGSPTWEHLLSNSQYQLFWAPRMFKFKF